MGFDKGNLNGDEQVVMELRPHWIYFVREAAVLLAAIVVGTLTVVFSAPMIVQLVAAVLLVAALGWFLWHYLLWATDCFIITSDRLIDRHGVFNRQGIEIPLERVNTVFFRQNLFERLIGSGDLIIESASEQGAQPVHNIRNPLRVQNEIYRQMEHNENRKYDRIGRGAVAPAPMASIPEQIEQLAALHRQGVLTDHEFQSKKKELLDRL